MQILKSPVIGIDLDNTVIAYDALIFRLALEQNLIRPGKFVSKELLRDSIRLTADGEKKWRKLQAQIYGPSIMEAVPMKGLKRFLRICRDYKLDVCIISHKTKFASNDAKINLRKSALKWLTKNRIIDYCDTPIAQKDVYFENTKIDKIDRINTLNCTHFIDDLLDVLNHRYFTSPIVKIWYANDIRTQEIPGIQQFGTWDNITNYFCCLLNENRHLNL